MLDAVVGEEAGGWPGQGDVPRLQHVAARSLFERRLHILLHDQDRRAELLVHLRQQPPQRAVIGLVEAFDSLERVLDRQPVGIDFLAVADHARLTGNTVQNRYDEARKVIDDLNELGISYDDVIEVLENEGVQKFEDSYTQLAESVHKQLEAAAK